MKMFIKNWIKTVVVVTAAVSILSSCNKDLPVCGSYCYNTRKRFYYF
jgi:hypothetical protein